MKTEHTPEPWATNGTRIESEHNHGWANDGWIIGGMDGPDAEANARRIVACVNACAGIPDEQLYDQEPGCLLSAMVEQEQEIMAITKQRDELLAALEEGRRLIELISPFEGDVTRQIDKAIASVKEKQNAAD